MYEIILYGAFESKFGSSSGPEVAIFERFAKSWSTFNHNLFKTGIDDEIVCSKLNQTERDYMKKFCDDQLKKSHFSWSESFWLPLAWPSKPSKMDGQSHLFFKNIFISRSISTSKKNTE